MRKARDVVDAVLASGETVYGLNTGLGSFYRYRIAPEDLERFSFATVADLSSSLRQAVPARRSAGDDGRAGPTAWPRPVSACGPSWRQLLVEVLNRGVHPVVREVGSVGQGDLSEMSDIGKVLIGIGNAEVDGEVMSGERGARTSRAAADRAGAERGPRPHQRERRDPRPGSPRPARRRPTSSTFYRWRPRCRSKALPATFRSSIPGRCSSRPKTGSAPPASG